jgi:hypothetical protein
MGKEKTISKIKKLFTNRKALEDVKTVHSVSED